MDSAWFIAAANTGAIVTLLIGCARWFRNWFRKSVSEPLRDLKQQQADLKRSVDMAVTESRRAHDRLDRHFGDTHPCLKNSSTYSAAS